MSLLTLQQDFQSALTDGDRRFGAQVESGREADADLRLDIYVQAYRLRLQDALASDYAKLAMLLGDTQFETLCRAYIAAHPSRHPSLRWLGRYMADFLAATPPWSDQPLLAEMAAFEWAQGEVFDAPDAMPVPPEAITALPVQAWVDLRLRAHPALRRLTLAWNVPSIWRDLDNGSEPPDPSAAGAPLQWLLWRQSLDIHWRSLGEDESWAIDAWCGGACFAEICEGLCDWMDAGVVAAYAASLLKGWLAAGLVTELVTDGA
jgi:hypothetical protein